MSLKVLVADDSVVFRRVLSEALTGLPNVEVVGCVANGKMALQRTAELRPDLLTLDMEMPEMDGLAVLDALRANGSGPFVLVVSALTRRGGQLTLRALDKGAFDFITKPDTATAQQSLAAIRQELAPRVRAIANRLEVRHILKNKPAAPAPKPATTLPALRSGAAKPGGGALGDIANRMNRLATARRPELVLVGVSTGGPTALARVLTQIPGDIGVPLLIVQHMPPVFTQSLAESLAGKCAIKVHEAAHGETVTANTAYIAPGGRQMRLHARPEGGTQIQITDDPPENNCRPAVDYLFRSVASQLPGRAMAVILTGMGNDGTLGLRLLKRNGCFTIAQDEATCVVYGMPKAAVEAGVIDAVLPLEAIASRIIATVRGTHS